MTKTPFSYPAGLPLWRKLQMEMFEAVRDDVADGEHWADMILALESMLEKTRANHVVGWKIPPRHAD